MEDLTPPPELFNKLKAEYAALGVRIRGDLGNYLVNNAYRAGADQELEACCLWVNSVDDADCFGANLRAARRPKPPSLKEQALMALEDGDTGPGASLTSNEVDIIRSALNQLPDS